MGMIHMRLDEGYVVRVVGGSWKSILATAMENTLLE